MLVFLVFPDVPLRLLNCPDVGSSGMDYSVKPSSCHILSLQAKKGIVGNSSQFPRFAEM